MERRVLERSLAATATLVAAATLVPSAARGAEPGFEPRQVVRPFEPITDPEHVSASESESWVRDPELVIGVALGNEARAYPINVLTNPTREIVNDTLGGQPVAATW